MLPRPSLRLKPCSNAISTKIDFGSDMLVDVIREFNRAVPFQPYEIRTNGGERRRVPHPDFIFVAPKGNWVMVTDRDDRPRHISTLLIE